MCLFTCRSYEAPSPDHRAIADSVSSLVTAVQNNMCSQLYVCHFFSWSRLCNRLQHIEDAKRNYCNKHDAAREILVTEARQEELRKETDDRDSCVREKRRYVKSNIAFF